MIVRAWLLGVLFGVMGGVLVLRLAWLQLFRGEEYERDIQEARMTESLIPARRGRILDRTGLTLVDNRICHDAAIVLKRLEYDAGQRRRIPFHVLDGRAIDLLAVHLGSRLQRPSEEVRQILTRELLLFPGVATRRGAPREEIALGLLAFPADLLVRAEGGEVHNDPAWADLAQSGLLINDPREAAVREYRLRRNRTAWLVTDSEFADLCSELALEYQAPAAHLSDLLRPHAPRVRLDLPDETTLAWLLVEEDALDRMAISVSRYLGTAARTTSSIREDLDRQVQRTTQPGRRSNWYFVPAARTAELGRRIPSSAAPTEVWIEGLPKSRAQVYVVQGNRPGGPYPGMFDLLLTRLADGLGLGPDADTEWLEALLEHHGRRRSCYQLEREFRVHHIAIDPRLLRRCRRRLSAVLRRTAAERSPLRIERGITMARRIADREWRDHTRHDPLVIIEDLPHDLALRLSGRSAELPAGLAGSYQDTEPDIPGLRIIESITRAYRFPRSCGHIIGFLGRLSSRYDQATALAMGLDPTGWMGRTGLEAVYDEILQGVVGRRLRKRTPTGYQLVDESPPIAGLDLELEIDSDLQRVAERSLANWFELARSLGTVYPRMERARQEVNHGRAGMALMDVETGGLLVLASTPGFDLREIRSEYAELADPDLHPGQPLHDHASEAAHPCGSAIKPLTAMLALKEGVVGLHEWVHSQGFMTRSASHRPILREHSPFSPRDFDVVTALQKSSNVFFATMGQRLGKDRLTHYQSLFGLGRRNALDVAWQRPGILPTPDNIATIAPHEPYWTNYRTWSQAIGQGLSTSPLQMVCIAAAVANDGIVLRPHLAKRAREDFPYEPYVFDIGPRELRAVREGMEKVTEPGGTARYLELAGLHRQVEVAAKTGSSEWGTSASRAAGLTPEHAWLIGYAPTDRPQVAFAIFIYAGCSGGRACSGVAKAVLEAYFRKYPTGHRRATRRSCPGALPF